MVAGAQCHIREQMLEQLWTSRPQRYQIGSRSIGCPRLRGFGCKSVSPWLSMLLPSVCVSGDASSQLPVTWLSCPQVTVHRQVEYMAVDMEGPGTLREPLCSRLGQSQPHHGHMPLEEAGWGPQEELPCVPKEEPPPYEEPGNMPGAWAEVLRRPDAGAASCSASRVRGWGLSV